MTDAELTVAAVRAKRWEIVKLRPREKKPAGLKWETTQNADLSWPPGSLLGSTSASSATSAPAWPCSIPIGSSGPT